MNTLKLIGSLTITSAIVLLTNNALATNTSTPAKLSITESPPGLQLAQLRYKCYARCKRRAHSRVRWVGLVGYSRSHAIARIRSYCLGGYRVHRCVRRSHVRRGSHYFCQSGDGRHTVYSRSLSRAWQLAHSRCMRVHRSYGYCARRYCARI